MFEFFRARRKIKSSKELAEEQLLSDLRNSLTASGESPNDTILKNRLRIIDLEDKVVKIEKQIKKIQQTLCVRAYRRRQKIEPKKKVK